jgi:ABC-2 type transport system permease protein
VSTLELELKEVRGPTAVSGSPRRFVNLTWLLATTDFKLSYFGSVLGYLWTLMQPLMFFGVLYFVFAFLLHFNNVKNFPVLLLMNIVLFGFFQQATGAAIPSVVVREGVVRKMQFPRLVIPLAAVTTSAINLFFNLIVVMIFMVSYGVQPRLTWLLLPFLVLALFVFTTGVSMLLSALYVRYRDIAPIWGAISQALYFASPVFILIDQILKDHHSLGRYYLFNPIATILQQARHWMVGGKPPGGLGAPAIMGGYVWLLVPGAIIVGVFLLGYWVFGRAAPRVAEEL